MAKFHKSILRENRTFISPDGKIDVTLDSKKHWAKNVNSFVGRGFDLPVFWDHPDDPQLSRPVKRSGRRMRAKDQAGWLTKAEVSADGSLDLEFDIPNKDDAKRVEHNLAKVSPVIWDQLEDGAGQVHENVFGAVDLVVHPVDHTQGKFEPVEESAIACSLVRMSLNSKKPKVFRMADDNDMVDEEVTESESDDSSIEETPVTNDSGRLEAVIGSLAGMNIILSDDTNEENFLEHLEQALLTAAAFEGDTDGTGEINTGTEDLDTASPEFAALSLERKQTIRMKQHFDKKHREDVAKRLSLLVEEGRCTPAEKKHYAPRLASIRLSLDDKGNHQPGSVEAFIASREAVPKGTFWTKEQRTRMSKLEVAKPPSGLLGVDVDDQDADEIVNQVFGRTKPKLAQLKG